MSLNDRQRAAVRYPGSIYLESCPGSGKTRTIVGKILHVVDEIRGSTRRVAAITYTNAGVEEMESRLRVSGTTDDYSYYDVSTIHAFCIRNVLRPFHYLLPQFARGFELLGPDDESWQEVVSKIIDAFDLPRTHATQEAFERIHRKAGGGIFTSGGVSEAAAEEFFNELDAGRSISFAEIMFHSARLVAAYPYIAGGLASQYAWLLIDECQDTSVDQVQLLRAIASYGRTQFFLVGDVNQAIMSFAGAQPGVMATFAESVGARRDMRLVGNYRCSARIVEHAERLWPLQDPMTAVGQWRDHPAEPEHYHVAAAATGVVARFLPRLREEGIDLGEAAVLAPWWKPLFLVGRVLSREGVPVVGPGARPYKRSHVFAGVAECLAAHLYSESPVSFGRLQRALFMAVRDLTAEAEWRVFGYPGRVVACRAIREMRGASQELQEWIRGAASVVGDLVKAEGWLSDEQGEKLIAGAEGMITDMRANGYEPNEVTIADIGLYAEPERAVHLLTMHRAKGQEFDAVAIIDLHEGRVPDFRAQDDEEIAEARRLLYVAVTRARRLLMYFTDNSHWRNEPSRFLGQGGLGLF